MSYNYFDELPAPARERYQSKLNLVGLDRCPYKLPADQWIYDLKAWPEVLIHDVYNYLLNFPQVFSRESMRNYKSLEAYRFCESGWVGYVQHLTTTPNHFVMRADVRPSYRVNDEPHHPWVAISNTGAVIAGHCDCMAGLGETCSHVAALLFKIETLVRLELTRSACTDRPCVWNECEREVKPAPVSQIKFYSKQRQSGSMKRQYTEPSEEEKETFLSALAADSSMIVGLSAFTMYNERFTVKRQHTTPQLPQPLRSLYKRDKQGLSSDGLNSYCSDLLLCVTSQHFRHFHTAKLK